MPQSPASTNFNTKQIGFVQFLHRAFIGSIEKLLGWKPQMIAGLSAYSY